MYSKLVSLTVHRIVFYVACSWDMVFFHLAIHILALSPVEITFVFFIFLSSKNLFTDTEVGTYDLKMDSTSSQIFRKLQPGRGKQVVNWMRTKECHSRCMYVLLWLCRGATPSAGLGGGMLGEPSPRRQGCTGSHRTSGRSIWERVSPIDPFQNHLIYIRFQTTEAVILERHSTGSARNAASLSPRLYNDT